MAPGARFDAPRVEQRRTTALPAARPACPVSYDADTAQTARCRRFSGRDLDHPIITTPPLRACPVGSGMGRQFYGWSCGVAVVRLGWSQAMHHISHSSSSPTAYVIFRQCCAVPLRLLSNAALPVLTGKAPPAMLCCAYSLCHPSQHGRTLFTPGATGRRRIFLDPDSSRLHLESSSVYPSPALASFFFFSRRPSGIPRLRVCADRTSIHHRQHARHVTPCGIPPASDARRVRWRGRSARVICGARGSPLSPVY